jgi:hypothetical protein
MPYYAPFRTINAVGVAGANPAEAAVANQAEAAGN